MALDTSDNIRFLVELGEKALLFSAILKGDYTFLLLVLVGGLTIVKILADYSDLKNKF